MKNVQSPAFRISDFILGSVDWMLWIYSPPAANPSGRMIMKYSL
jgi:hypothetical protein